MAKLKKNQVSKHRKQGRRSPPPPKKKAPSSGTGLVIGTLLAAVLIAAVVFFLRPSDQTSSAVRTFDLTGQPLLGQADAPVTMVIVEDFKCPACRAFEASVLPQLISKYVDSGTLKVASLTWPFLAKARNLPVDDSLLAAEAAECVYDQQESAGYFAYSKLLFGSQEDETRVWATKDKLKQLASGLEKLDQTKFGQCLDSDATKARVLSDQKQILAAGVSSTPSIFVGGKLVTQNSLEAISTAVEAVSQ
ncbi:DsbA family protein [Deinococcus psychrotolerans]|uniref:DsbA family protein n=1 Tax=Deinococcus psychrotolerans TaxID=2489213 RepID=A0A3G8Y900_9DEIO|nr:thioredoxin domain-containing protein [Deinococcus psychrotolerans]AZI41655.1 DsbA family protein [Deinococcus psychrotolerans]